MADSDYQVEAQAAYDLNMAARNAVVALKEKLTAKANIDKAEAWRKLLRDASNTGAELVTDLTPVPVEPELPPVYPEPIPPDQTPVLPVPLAVIYVAPATKGNGNGQSAANATGIGSVLSGGIAPGTHLDASGDVFSDSYALTSAGTKENPIFIRYTGANGRALFNKNAGEAGNITLKAPFTALYGLEFAGSGRKVVIDTFDARVSSCLTKGTNYDGTFWLKGDNYKNARFDRCRWEDIVGAAIRSDGMNVNKWQNVTGVVIEICHFLRHTIADNGSSEGGNEAVIQILGNEFDKIGIMHRQLLFEDCQRLNTNMSKKSESELISAKTGWPSFIDITVLKSGNANISLRCTQGVTMQRLWLENGSFVKGRGDDCTLENSYSDGKLVDLMYGNAYTSESWPAVCNGHANCNKFTLVQSGSSCKVAMTTPRRWVIEHNIGNINVGVGSGSAKVDTVTARNNDRAMIRNANTFVNVTETGIGQNVTTARKLTPAMVGPGAP